MSENERAARNRKITKIIMWIVLLILFIMIVFPFIMVVINVFKTKADINSHPLALIGKHGFTTKNFPKAIPLPGITVWTWPASGLPNIKEQNSSWKAA